MILKQKWDQIRYGMHRTKVRNAKPVIDNRMPVMYLTPLSNLKKKQKEAERRATIIKDNNQLIKKIGNIMNTNRHTAETNNINYSPRSLNRSARQRELLQIAYENEAIVKRIQSKTTHYSQFESMNDWGRNRAYATNMSRYPSYAKTKFQGSQFVAGSFQYNVMGRRNPLPQKITITNI
jgi:hypothetical protein